MQLPSLFFCAVIAAGSSFVTLRLATESQDAEKGKAASVSPDDMKKYMAAAQPGEPHKRLQELVGEWNIDTEMPAEPMPVKSKGTAEFKSILGGRFVMETARGEMMGMPREDIRMHGYDNVAKKYLTVLLGTMSTGVNLATGTADPTGKVITFTGLMQDAVAPDGRPFTVFIRHKDKDNFVVEVFNTVEGKELRHLTANYTRKK